MGKVKRLFSKKANKLDTTTQKILFQQFYDSVYYTIFRYVKNRESALEVLNETFIRAFTYISSYQERQDGSFEGWLATIARNESIKYLQKRWQGTEIPMEEIGLDNKSLETSSYNTIDDIVISNIQKENMRHAIDQLPAHYREIILLRTINEFTHQEIATILGITENGSRQLYHRSRLALKKLVQEQGGELHYERRKI